MLLLVTQKEGDNKKPFPVDRVDATAAQSFVTDIQNLAGSTFTDRLRTLGRPILLVDDTHPVEGLEDTSDLW